ncbi:uncharacterized protein LOC126909644 [Daktulosphaira vitifoliae]|uniref:uncharacterized protein LOC126909644 n=1 Tax=Daktulosphaira vitifoliae TaxID=58002 RepID=UPI0021A9AFB3|nr:uncharacterized protein LOC126909644 [Daktulosphaira vitifoliae]
MKSVKLLKHPYYIKSRNEENFCPVPWSHAVHCEEVPYEGIEIVNKKLTDVVQRCRRKRKFKLGYTIYLNAIESIAFTYMYRFCEFAIEMNQRCVEISFYLKVFSDTLHKIIPIINREWISPKPHECILDVYENHKSEENKFNEENENYRNDLLRCMNLMKDKVHFLREPKDETINTMTISQLEHYNNMSYNYITYHLTLDKYSSPLKHITGDKNQTSCIICETEHSGTIWHIYFFSPCGHGWCCDECFGDIEACPICNELITSTPKLDIRTSVSIVTEKYKWLPPRCILDGREARCVKCRSQINHSNRHIMIPCSHGWYCENCIEDEKCSICSKKKTDKLRIILKNNELHSN